MELGDVLSISHLNRIGMCVLPLKLVLCASAFLFLSSHNSERSYKDKGSQERTLCQEGSEYPTKNHGNETFAVFMTFQCKSSLQRSHRIVIRPLMDNESLMMTAGI